MATNTTNYNLIKPALNETADIQIINDNMDKIDTELKKINDGFIDIKVPVTTVNNKTGDVVLSATDIKTADNKTIEQKFTDVNTSKVNKLTSTVTLLSNGWNNNSQTINLANIKSNSLLWVTPTPSSLKTYSESMIYASTQNTGTITFICDTVPTVDLQVQVTNGGDV